MKKKYKKEYVRNREGFEYLNLLMFRKSRASNVLGIQHLVSAITLVESNKYQKHFQQNIELFYLMFYFMFDVFVKN